MLFILCQLETLMELYKPIKLCWFIGHYIHKKNEFAHTTSKQTVTQYRTQGYITRKTRIRYIKSLVLAPLVINFRFEVTSHEIIEFVT